KVTYTKDQVTPNTFTASWELLDANSAPLSTPVTGSKVLTFDASGNLATIGGLPASDTNLINVVDAASKINLNVDPRAVKEAAQNSTISSTVDGGREPNVVNGTLTIFDSLGNSHTLTLKFTKTTSNGWNWNANVPAGTGSLVQNSGTISFNTDGSIAGITPSPTMLGFTPGNGAANQNISLDFGKNFSGITQTSSGSAVSPSTQNGTAAASLLNLNVDQYGNIVGVFSNGESQNLAQVMVANFNNLNGLINAGDNMFTVGANSGAPMYGEPGESSRTTVNSGALEQSNVDLSEEFTKMIVSQRGFQANARVITTADNLLQEITQLVR
ncbi:MAG: flagellar hook-basal body complex protein, partial [Ignavibacteriales bacterium]|nr:flagellar hook-basal body complex protein [Ignavibacteriales bacterium]